MMDQELEVKYYVDNLREIEQHAIGLGAVVSQPRTHEINLRFDTLDGSLTRKYQVLRLRQDTAARLTFKGPTVNQEGVRVRQEIEFTVSDFGAARRFLEALGYQVAMIYEKFRTVYDLAGVHITLDEMPYGNFVELEGPDTGAIQAVNQQLGLNWDAGISESYVVLFNQLCESLKLDFRDLIFENFSVIDVSSDDLGVLPADHGV